MKMGPKCKYIDTTKLPKPMKVKLMKHSNHHTLKHIKHMVKEITKNKKTFVESHKIALKKSGK